MKSNFKQITLRAALASAFACGMAATAVNTYAATASTPAQATVITPISGAAGLTLQFGTLTKAAGTVTVETNGARTASGGATTLSALTPGAAGTVTISGNANSTYSITSGGAATLTGTGATPPTMSVTPKWDTSAAATAANPATGTLGAGGTQTLYVGGVLTVAPTQATDTYTGNVSLTVEYN